MASPLIVLTASNSEASEWHHSIWQQMLSAGIPHKYGKHFIPPESLQNESWPDGRARYVPNGLRMVETLLLREYAESDVVTCYVENPEGDAALGRRDPGGAPPLDLRRRRDHPRVRPRLPVLLARDEGRALVPAPAHNRIDRDERPRGRDRDHDLLGGHVPLRAAAELHAERGGARDALPQHQGGARRGDHPDLAHHDGPGR